MNDIELDDKIFFKAGCLYQTTRDYVCRTKIRPEKEISTYFLTLTVEGLLKIRRGYAGDGPSGPTKLIARWISWWPWLKKQFLKTFMRGAWEHDAKYDLIRQELLDQKWRKTADSELYDTCREDKMSEFRADYVYKGVRFGGGPSADPDNQKKELSAP